MDRFRVSVALCLSAVFLFFLLPSGGRAAQDTVPEGWVGIYDSEDLRRISLAPDGQYVLMNDVDLTGTVWTALCSEDLPFCGTLNGNGHTVYGMNVSSLSSACGLFSYIYGGTVRDLTVRGSASGPIAGLLVGKIGSGELSGCTVSGSVTSDFCGGGMVGQISGTGVTVSDGTADCTVSGTGTENSEVLIGGVVGGVYGVNHSVSSCESSGTLSFSGAVASVGGVVGLADGSLTVSDSGTEMVLSLSVSDLASVGGVLGRGGASDLSLLRCSFRSDWSVPACGGRLNMGGIVGELCGEKTALVDACVSYGSLASSASSASLGGTVGQSRAQGGSVRISRCSSFVSLSGTGCSLALGGIVGINQADTGSVTVENCYGGGSVTHTESVHEDTTLFFGGIAGLNGGDGTATLSRCFSACEINVTYPLGDGAVVGLNAAFSEGGTAAVTQCYYRAGVREFFATAVSGAALSDPLSYPGFDFETVWTLDGAFGMPLLRASEPSEGSAVVGDVDGNGKITEYDARLLSQYLTGNVSLTDGQKRRSDFNGDGRLDAKDVSLILRNAG